MKIDLPDVVLAYADYLFPTQNISAFFITDQQLEKAKSHGHCKVGEAFALVRLEMAGKPATAVIIPDSTLARWARGEA